MDIAKITNAPERRDAAEALEGHLPNQIRLKSYLSLASAVNPCRSIGTTDWSRYCLVGNDWISGLDRGVSPASFSSLMIF